MGLTDAIASLTVSNSSSPRLPGRFGDDDMTIETEPRANQAMVKFMKAIGLSKTDAGPALSATDYTKEKLLSKLREDHQGFIMLTKNVPYQLPDDDEHPVTTETKVIKGGDGQDLKIYITRPKDASGTLPCIIYTHGGGMAVIPTDNPVHHAWCRDLANGGDGAVVVMPDFRNAYDDVAHDLRPFPTGLNDCAAAVQWVGSHKEQLGIGKILICGESGGGNLAIATALKLKKEGKGVVDGVYARCPFISGVYGRSRERLVEELPSLVECDGYFLSTPSMWWTAKAYTDSETDDVNPLAWPYHATEEDLKGSVPHTILVDELDPLRDEGLAFARKLERAGVRTVARLSVGTVHAAPQLMRIPLRDIRFSDVEDMHGFLKRL